MHATIAEEREDPVGVRAEPAEVTQAVDRFDAARARIAQRRLQGQSVGVDTTEQGDAPGVQKFLHATPVS
ncbi:MAG: hypothetical protein ACREJV_08790 [Candidatus Rokuibacteriota bacterium]